MKVVVMISLFLFMATQSYAAEMVLRGKVVMSHLKDAGNVYIIKTSKKNVTIGSVGSFSDQTEECLRNAVDSNKKVELRGKKDQYGLLDQDATCKEVN